MLVRCGNSAQLSQVELACNTGDDDLFFNVRENSRLGLPVVGIGRVIEQPAVVVAGGASLLGTLKNIEELKAGGAKIFALNNTARFLVEHGIQPDAQVMVDPRPLNEEFVSRKWAGELYAASQCHPGIVKRALAEGYEVHVFHALINDIDKHIYRTPVSAALQRAYERTKWRWLGLLAGQHIKVTGGLTVGLTGLCMIYTLGYRRFHLFGYDSCHQDGKSHAYRQDANLQDELVQVTVKDRTFTASTTMAGQAQTFPELAKMLEACGCSIELYGDGLIQHIMAQARHVPKVLTAVYDLGLSPPTYDFVAFLVEAERARIAKGLERIDVVFEPGPMHGFRGDDLPPSAEARAGMLSRICVAMCRLLPSVRNVHVLRNRAPVTGVDVFPEGYLEDNPRSHYGVRYLKGCLLCLKATPSAVAYVKAKLKRPYATITMRESSYWPERNSNLEAWLKVAEWLKARGVDPVFLPDTEGNPVVRFKNMPETIDVDIRMALYEGAEINLGVSNGPIALLYASNAPYLIFKPVVQGVHSASIEFLNANGIQKGDSYGGNGRLIWEDDDYETIIREVEKDMIKVAA